MQALARQLPLWISPPLKPPTYDQFLVRRGIEMVITLVLASVLLFGILNLAPGGPSTPASPPNHIQDPTYLAALNKLIGLDKPIHERYIDVGQERPARRSGRIVDHRARSIRSTRSSVRACRTRSC